MIVVLSVVVNSSENRWWMTNIGTAIEIKSKPTRTVPKKMFTKYFSDVSGTTELWRADFISTNQYWNKLSIGIT